MCKKLLHKDLLENTSIIFILNNRLNKSVNCFKIGFLLFIGVIFFNSQNLFSQDNDSRKSEEVTSQISKALLPNFFDEVHKGSEYKYDSERERIYLEQLSRIEIICIPNVENIHHPKLSSLGKMEKYNPNLNFDLTNFNPSNFNFIKYGFNFYVSYDQFIRVDNHDYIIHISPYIK